MAEPTCPAGWDCDFVYNPPPEPYNGPWWEAPHAWIIAVGLAAAVLIALVTISYYWWQYRHRRAELASHEREAIRREAHERAIEEQRTMQLDAAKGDPEMLKIVRQR